MMGFGLLIVLALIALSVVLILMSAGKFGKSRSGN
jgi:hypothetical protein